MKNTKTQYYKIPRSQKIKKSKSQEKSDRKMGLFQFQILSSTLATMEIPLRRTSLVPVSNLEEHVVSKSLVLSKRN